jgi:serine/threonine-protein kinase
MFLDEARLAARVQHPNVVATIDVVATDGELFLIMDYVRGESLARLVRATVRLHELVPPRVVAAIMCGFMHGLHAAHEAKNERGEPLGLIHRDVSPQNVLVGSDGVARVLDFGVAKAAGRIQVTRDGQVKGKLSYMPPEQLSGGELTRTVDIYASAVVLWEALTGERLFKGESEGETLHKILRGAIEPPSVFVPGLNPKYDEVCMRALSRDTSKRYATAREMALALERCEGIASPTEVGEWVERVVGSDLHVRETRIAEIESNSAALHGPISAQMPPDSSANGAHLNGPLSSQGPSSQGARPVIEQTLVGVGPDPASMGALPVSGHVPSSQDAGRRRGRGPQDDSEVSRKRGGSGLTALMTLPMERRLPYLIAGGAGLLILLLLVIGITLVARRTTETAATEPSTSASSALATASAPSSSVAAVEPAKQDVIIPGPASAPAESASVAAVEPPKPPQSAATAIAAATTKPTYRPPPPPPPTAKKPNCDPPYTLDAKGHKHFKVECN